MRVGAAGRLGGDAVRGRSRRLSGDAMRGRSGRLGDKLKSAILSEFIIHDEKYKYQLF